MKDESIKESHSTHPSSFILHPLEHPSSLNQKAPLPQKEGAGQARLNADQSPVLHTLGALHTPWVASLWNGLSARTPVVLITSVQTCVLYTIALGHVNDLD